MNGVNIYRVSMCLIIFHNLTILSPFVEDTHLPEQSIQGG